ncbi:diguanylate cyclase/phosphodiesterase (GGDEF & EAL domains) with PAS/PAC sensor(s) [Euzebya pacifica]|uniref:Diguanylate cyclase/phosphodiesterase (GGDEF & EAL domains) with PAS/PAC sensor(S) n=1 Tax=Euzebya pacifica TaxID=1608957 RepID=A0A346XRM5_9ACTN|nr:diguanylate cyclase/phosphodiesterase (GGDEF & EAL domains) with PAS/PAC sensor(s) [Euzebya pacifica]
MLLAALALLVGDETRVAVRGLQYLLAAAAGTVSLLRVRRAKGPRLPAFWLLVGACTLYALSNGTRVALPDGGPGELLNGLASLLLLGAGAVFVRGIRPGHGRHIILDGLIVGLIASMGLREIAALTGDPLVATSTPSTMLIIGLVGTSLWLRAIATDPSGAVRSFALAAGLAIPGTILTALQGLGPVRPRSVDVWTVVSSLLLVHALSHRDLSTIRPGPAPVYRRVTAASVALMCLALTAAPALMWSRMVLGSPPDLGLAMGMTALSALWVGRFSLMLIDRDLDRARLDEELATDPLTGVASRRQLTDHLDSLLLDSESDADVAVLMADVDEFKAVNDRHGHRAGDQALIAVAARLEKVVGDRGLVARLSGDEFTVVVQTADPLTLRKEVTAALESVTVAAEPLIVVRASVGMAIATPGETSSHTLMERADRAMYRHKRRLPTTAEQVDLDDVEDLEGATRRPGGGRGSR